MLKLTMFSQEEHLEKPTNFFIRVVDFIKSQVQGFLDTNKFFKPLFNRFFCGFYQVLKSH